MKIEKEVAQAQGKFSTLQGLLKAPGLTDADVKPALDALATLKTDLETLLPTAKDGKKVKGYIQTVDQGVTTIQDVKNTINQAYFDAFKQLEEQLKVAKADFNAKLDAFLGANDESEAAKQAESAYNAATVLEADLIKQKTTKLNELSVKKSYYRLISEIYYNV